MPRRRLSERQITRIQRIQERRRNKLEERTEQVLDQLDALGETPSQHGLVVVRHGANLVVEDAQDHRHQCVTRRHIGYPVCGDHVVWQPGADGSGVVTAIQPRSTVLSRPDASGHEKPLAANITLILVVIAPEPRPTGSLVDHYLVAAERIGVKALVLCNKMDLLTDAARSDFLGDLERYRHIGYPVIPISIREDARVAAVRPHISAQTSILVGQSGVGKSSLINALVPAEDIQVGALSSATGLGRHTTSAATSYRLDDGARLIDSPGVRSFRLGPMSRSALEQGFPEFRSFLGHCRFVDCSHRHEPECAIQAAAAAGAIAPQRLQAFHQLAETLTKAEHRDQERSNKWPTG